MLANGGGLEPPPRWPWIAGVERGAASADGSRPPVSWTQGMDVEVGVWRRQSAQPGSVAGNTASGAPVADRSEQGAPSSGSVAASPAAGSRIVDDVMTALGPLLPPRRPAGPDVS